MKVKKKANRVFSFVFALLISFGQVFSGFPGFMNIAYADDAPYGTISAKIEGQDSNGSVLKDKEFTLTVNFTIREDQECISGTYFKFMFDPTAVSYTKHSGKDTANPGALLSPSSDSGDPSTGSFVRQHTFEKVHSGTKWITTVYTFKALRDITAANNLDITVDIFKNFSEAYQKNIHGISIEPALANAGTHDLATIGGHDGTGKIILPVAKAVETKYTVTYAAGDGTGIVPTDSKSPYEKDAAVSVLGKGDLTKEGHSFDGWLNSVDNKKYNEGETFTITADTTLTAQWKKNADDVVPQDDPDGPKPDVPDNYVKVDFAAGEHGTIDAGEKTIYWVNPEKEVTVSAPKVTADKGYTFDKWDKELKGTFKAATTITAEYKKNATGGDVVPQKPGEDKPDVPDSYVKVDFAAGEHGTIAAGETTIYWVNPEKEVTVSAPKVTADKGYTFDKWDKELKGTFKAATTITAEYKKITYSIEDEDGNPVTPKEPLDNLKPGDKIEDKNGNKYVTKTVGEPDPATGISKVIVSKITYSIEDEDGNPVTPKEPLDNLKPGDKIEDKNGNKYVIKTVGEPDPATGISKVIVSKDSSTFGGKTGNTSSKPGNRGKVGGTSPKTGDNSNRMFYLSTAGLSAGALVALFLTEKKRRKNNKE